jgi:methionine--tRNA ligase beta chain
MKVSQKTGELSIWAGVLKCKDCGRAMNKKSSTNKRGNTYEYYICSTYRKKSNNLCTNHTIKAEKLEKADKLLKVQVDLGDEVRQVVAGIAKRYSPEQLIDRKVIVVANLEPAKLFGVESNGMLLATDSMELLTTEGKVGEHIR